MKSYKAIKIFIAREIQINTAHENRSFKHFDRGRPHFSLYRENPIYTWNTFQILDAKILFINYSLILKLFSKLFKLFNLYKLYHSDKL